MMADTHPLLSNGNKHVSISLYDAAEFPSIPSSGIDSERICADEESSNNSASVALTSINIAKTCIGTATLALPYASSEGGLLFSSIGIALIATWNIYAVQCLDQCLFFLPFSDNNKMGVDDDDDEDDEINKKIFGNDSSSLKKEHRRTLSSKRRFFKKLPSFRVDLSTIQAENDEKEGNDDNGTSWMDLAFSNIRDPPEEVSTFGKVSWFCFGHIGLIILDILLIVLFIGIVVSYLDIIALYLKAMPISTGSSLNLILAAIIITPLCCVPNVGFLAKTSALGIFAVLFTFVVIFCYGIKEYGAFTGLMHNVTWESLWPRDMNAVCNWFGVVVYSFGIVPLTYDIKESMKEPKLMMDATKVALFSVLFIYVIIGNGVEVLFSPENPNNSLHFEGEVLGHVGTGWIPTFIRATMVFMVIVTIPLLVIPCGDIIAGKLGENYFDHENHYHRIAIRTTVCVLCTAISTLIPNFISVLSFVGSCAVSFVSFVLPPLFHLVLQYKANAARIQTNKEALNVERIVLDLFMLTVGVFATVISSVLTFRSLIE